MGRGAAVEPLNINFPEEALWALLIGSLVAR
jgi:hypothetical protein